MILSIAFQDEMIQYLRCFITVLRPTSNKEIHTCIGYIYMYRTAHVDENVTFT